MADVVTFYYRTCGWVNTMEGEAVRAAVVERRRMASEYTLRIPQAIEDRLLQCTGSMRAAINARLLEITRSASASARRGPAAAARPRAPQGPPLRFYVFEGYRVFYRLDSGKRTVVVLDLRPETA